MSQTQVPPARVNGHPRLPETATPVDLTKPGTPAEVPEQTPTPGTPEETPAYPHDEVPVPVDNPNLPAPEGTWVAQRRAYLADAPPILHPALRRATDFTYSARWAGAYYGHVTAFHTVRSPLYLGRLIARSPRGTGRLIARWGRWMLDTEARPVTAKAAAAADIDAWLLLSREHSRRVKPRRTKSLVLATATAIAATAGTLLAPWWVLAPTSAALLALLGLAGGKPDTRIITRYVEKDTMRALTSTEVLAALAAIGIDGKKGRGGATFAAEVQRDGPGWRAEVNLPAGVTADKVVEKRAQLAAAMRRPISTVWPEGDRDAHPGRLVLWVAQQDPAKAPRRLWPLMKAGQADVFKPLPFGFDPRGNLVEITLMYSNLLVGGIPGSGKTSCALAIVLGCALDPTTELWIYELKGSGDLDSVKPVCHRYVSGDEDEDLEATLDGLRAGIAEQRRRAKFIKSLPASETPEGRRVTRELEEKYPEQQLGPRLIVVDEVQELFTHPEYKDEAAALCTKLIKKGRAYGVILILLTQNPDAASLPTSVASSVGTRLCLAVMDWRANNNVLGTGAHERGMRATEISVGEQGTGILARGREGLTVRAAFIKQTEAEEIGKRALAIRTAAGTVTGEAAGEQVEQADVTTVVDHLRDVWPGDADAVHSHRLVEALAAYRPDLYGMWLDEEDAAARSTALSAALRPHKVRTAQLTIRDCCGGAKGVRWADVPEPE